MIASCFLLVSSLPSHIILLTANLGYGLVSPFTRTSELFLSLYQSPVRPFFNILLPSLVVRMLRYRIKDATLVPVDKTLTMVSPNPHFVFLCHPCSTSAAPPKKERTDDPTDPHPGLRRRLAPHSTRTPPRPLRIRHL